MTFLFLYSFASLFKAGISAKHGGHAVNQKLSTTIFPFSFLNSISLPATVLNSISGTGLFITQSCHFKELYAVSPTVLSTFVNALSMQSPKPFCAETNCIDNINIDKVNRIFKRLISQKSLHPINHRSDSLFYYPSYCIRIFDQLFQ